MSKVNFGFWENLKRPIMALAPMADVTDAAYRRLIAKHGKPDVMFTEFVSADGLTLADELGKTRLKKDLMFTEAERPIVAQFFSGKPEMIERAAKLARTLGFDGIDVNMGCPDRGVERQGAGAALMKNPKLAAEIIAAAKRGAGPLPISVKTRIGYNRIELDAWIPALLETGLAAISVHARTRKELSLVPARWEHVREAVAWRNKLKKKTLILGNGDLASIEDARRRAMETGADGAMLGRAVFGNPFLFSSSRELGNRSDPLVRGKVLAAILEHTKLFEELFGGEGSPCLPRRNSLKHADRTREDLKNCSKRVKNFSSMKKHYKAYASGWNGAKELRLRLMETKNAREVEKILSEYRSSQQARL